MSTIRCTVAGLLLMTSILPFAEAPQTSSTAELIASLEKLTPWAYYDFHGNAHDHLQTLMIARFGATSGITQSIDRLERTKEQADLVRALYHVLAFVKDPASIDWLRSKVRKGGANPFYALYLPNWRELQFQYETRAWIEEPERWIAFFVATFRGATDSNQRTDLLRALSGFDEPSVVNFFNRQHAAALGPRETLLVAAYLQLRGGNLDEERIRKAVETLAAAPTNREFLVEVAYQLRHPALVPYLISITVPQPDKNPAELQGALERITFELGTKGKAEWERWYATYGRDGREKWLERSLQSMRQMIRENEKAAVTFFHTALQRWDDIGLLTFVERELVVRPAFHNDIAVWTALTYRPPYRSRLEPIARKLVADSPSLTPWSRELLVEGFLPGGRQGTWREHVRASNRFI